MSTFDARDCDWDDWDDYGAGADYEPAIVICPECGGNRYADRVMRLPSDAQARLLALVQRHEDAGEAVEWNVAGDHRRSRAHLVTERVDRRTDMARFESADSARDHRVATVRACLSAEWLSDLHTRSVMSLTLVQLDLTEDGGIERADRAEPDESLRGPRRA